MALHKALHHRYLMWFYELNGRKNICIMGNVTTLQNNSKKRNSGK